MESGSRAQRFAGQPHVTPQVQTTRLIGTLVAWLLAMQAAALAADAQGTVTDGAPQEATNLTVLGYVIDSAFDAVPIASVGMQPGMTTVSFQRRALAFALIGRAGDVDRLARQNPDTPNLYGYVLMRGNPEEASCRATGRLSVALRAVNSKGRPAADFADDAQRKLVLLAIPFRERSRIRRAPASVPVEEMCTYYDYELSNLLVRRLERQLVVTDSSRLPKAKLPALPGFVRGGPILTVSFRPLHLLSVGDNVLWLEFGRFNDATLKQVLTEISAVLYDIQQLPSGEFDTGMLRVLEAIARIDDARGWIEGSMATLREVRSKSD